MEIQNKKKNTAGGGLYIALAICILSIICIGVYSAILNVFDNATVTPPILEESGNKTPIPTPETNQTPTPPQEEKPQNPPVA